MSNDVWTDIAERTSDHDETVRELEQYRERARQAPVLFAHPDAFVAMFESRQARSESRLRSVIECLPDSELPRAIAHQHALVRRLAVGEKARRLKARMAAMPGDV